MAINKPTKPSVSLPDSFGGIKTPYTESQIESGYEDGIPQIVDGGNINYEKDGLFQKIKYCESIADVIKDIPAKKVLSVNNNNKFDNVEIGIYSYSATQSYNINDFVISVVDEKARIYRSLSSNNLGEDLKNTIYWEEVALGVGGLEVGDIGIAPFGIDETKNTRRYLNGQVISQNQFSAFATKIKAAVILYPNLATTETNWQAEVTNSKFDQCGKFVIDDTAGTIRLPKVVNINGLTDLSLLGGIKNESLPNITGSFYTTTWPGRTDNARGAFLFEYSGGAYLARGDYAKDTRYSFNAHNSSSTYQEGAPVQQEAIQYPYFIQVATASEDEADITNEIQLNNPFYFGMSQYSESAPNNASWLISNGSYHSGTTYDDFYQWLLKIYNGTLTVAGVSVKLSTASDISDYDYVINTANTTFRLPIYDGSESLPGTVTKDLFSRINWNSTSDYSFVAPTNGVISIYASFAYDTGGDARWLRIVDTTNGNNNFGINGSNQVAGGVGTSLACSRGDNIMIVHGMAMHLTEFNCSFICNKGEGSLYYYVGETIQDANIIAASNALTDIANLTAAVNSLTNTKENVSNKVTNFNSPNNTTYPTTAAVNSHITSIMNNYQYASKGSNWVKFTNGLIIQWGRTNISTITFGTPFTQNGYGISATCNYTRKTSDAHGLLNTPTLTNIQLAGVDNDMYPVYWVAIGY